MFEKVGESEFLAGEHQVLRFWTENRVFDQLREKNRGKKRWNFLDGPITANNPMGVHHAWGRTYKDAFQRYFAMIGCDQRYQNGFDCQGLWVEVEVEKELQLATKDAVNEFGVDRFVNECKKRVLKFAARQTEQSIRLGYWTDWDDPGTLRLLSEKVGSDDDVTITTPSGKTVTDKAHELVARLGNPEWGGSYFTFSTENNETIWTFLKKCFERGKIYRGYDVMPWSGRAGSAYSQMEVADGRKLTVHRSCFVRFPITEKVDGLSLMVDGQRASVDQPSNHQPEYLLVWTTTPWTLTSNVACAVNPDLEYVKLQTKRDGAIYYFAKENLEFKRQEQQFKEGFGSDGKWPKDVPKLKTIAQIFKEQGGYEVLGTLKGAEMIGWRYEGPFDELEAQQSPGGHPFDERTLRDRRNAILADFAEIAFVYVDLQAFTDDLRSVAAQVDDVSGSNATSLLEKAAGAFRGLIFHGAFRFAPELPGFNSTFPNLTYVLWKLDLALVFGSQWEQISNLSNSIQSLIDSERQVPSQLFRELATECLNAFNVLHQQLANASTRSGIESHRVIDGGRDSKGNPNVVAGEGTGIVHIAPGCGDVDHKIGEELGLPSIAPLGEDGTFGEGFGPFTGKEAIDPATADLVFEKLKENHKLVAVEQYPHIYPHCWRTGDELVFRLVDEWFINMDWRDEIKEVVKAIRWHPDSIQGRERELEWLSNMRDWMVSKKRFWGLALPIWINPEDPGDFEVVGSLAELKERAVEGWDDFAGNTPHRPWIDRVKIRSEKTGATLSRIVDVGNPWLDAGIVPFSTMQYNSNPDEWAKWYPADFITECFPGQFRNWFYSLLSLATMMRYDETDDPQEKRPFKNLLGHRLVMDEQGRPMHKSDGTAIWFEEAAEQLGVDTLRWLYLAQNPAQDLRFGTRHPDEPVALQTPEGTITETKEGLPTCKVTSSPADEVRRQILIPLWNSYAFFVNYARLDEFDPASKPVPFEQRPEIDRWILSNLQALVEKCRAGFENYDAPAACAAAAEFIDDLSNWYIRRNRRRFWRSRKETQADDSSSDAWDADKLAAYQTLYEVLVSLTKTLAPIVPFLTERMYQNLAVAGGKSADVPESVHLCDYPEPDFARLDPGLNQRMAVAQIVVKLGHKLREESSLRVRQPLGELRYACRSAENRQAIESLGEIVREELNVKQLTAAENLDDLVSYSFKPNLKTLGPKYGKLLGAIRKELPAMDPAVFAPLRTGESVTVSVGGEAVLLEPDDVLVSTEQAADWVCADDRGIQIALSTKLSAELIAEGVRNDFIRHVQQARKDANLEIQDRIRVYYQTDDAAVQKAISQWAEYIGAETLADEATPSSDPPDDVPTVAVGEAKARVWIANA